MENVLTFDKFCNEKLNIKPITKGKLNELGNDYAVFKRNLLTMVDMIEHDPKYSGEIDRIDLRMQFDGTNSDIYSIPSNEKEMGELWDFIESNLKEGKGLSDNDGETYIFVDAYYNDDEYGAEFIDYSMTVRYSKDKGFVITIAEK